MVSPVKTEPTCGRGIGAAIALRLGREGHTVVIGDYLEEEAHATAERIVADGGKAVGVSCDVRQVKDIHDLFAAARANFGLPTILVNNAGIYPNNAALTMTEEQWDNVMATNLGGTFFCCQTLARGLVHAARPGIIVNIASTSAYSARAGASHYSASKAATVMLTKSLAHEFGAHNIRVNCIAPGLVAAKEGLVSEEYRERFIEMVPSRRIGKVDAFLVSEKSDYINGETIVIDGGFLSGRSLPRSLT